MCRKTLQVLLWGALCLTTLTATASPHQKVAIYVAAHQDDWQLFMGCDFYNDAIDRSNKIILIITTSGGIEPYPITVRDSGTLQSIQYVTDSQPGPKIYETGFLPIKNHQLTFYLINNVMTVFFHLPDGNIDGNGFEESNCESLVKLQDGTLQSITTTDSLNIYQNWQELTDVLRGVFQSQINLKKADISLHLPDTASAYNLEDHPDHIASTYLTLNALKGVRAHHYYYSQYQNEYLPDNLTGEDSVRQTGLFDAYEFAATRGMGRCTTCYTDLYKKWCVRSYSRKID